MPRTGRPSTLPEPWKSLAAKHGGVGALAELFVATPRAVHHWAHGKREISSPAKKVLARLLNEAGLDQAGAKNKNED